MTEGRSFQKIKIESTPNTEKPASVANVLESYLRFYDIPGNLRMTVLNLGQLTTYFEEQLAVQTK